MTFSVEDLRVIANQTVAGRLHFKLLTWQVNKPSYTEWVELVEEAVQYELSEMAQRRNDLHGMDEDQLTATLVIALSSLTFDASGRVVNGNCDLAVKFDDYSWLGEAKIARDSTTIYGGYLQLTQRYASGLSNQSAGAMLLYCTNDVATAVLAGWRAALAEQVPHANVRDGNSALDFRSSDFVESTGLPLEILHMAFPLKHDPKEDTRKLSPQARAAGRSAKRRAKAAN